MCPDKNIMDTLVDQCLQQQQLPYNCRIVAAALSSRTGGLTCGELAILGACAACVSGYENNSEAPTQQCWRGGQKVSGVGVVVDSRRWGW